MLTCRLKHLAVAAPPPDRKSAHTHLMFIWFQWQLWLQKCEKTTRGAPWLHPARTAADVNSSLSFQGHSKSIFTLQNGVKPSLRFICSATVVGLSLNEHGEYTSCRGECGRFHALRRSEAPLKVNPVRARRRKTAYFPLNVIKGRHKGRKTELTGKKKRVDVTGVQAGGITQGSGDWPVIKLE